MTTIGLVPAAGRGTRFGLHGPKELAHLGPGGDDLLIGFALQALCAAGVRRTVVVVSPEKSVLREVLGRRAFGMAIEYAVQRRPQGLPDAIAVASPMLGDHDVLFAMPDTVFLPMDVLGRVARRRHRERADVVLGVFPCDVPTELAPVELDDAGAFVRVHDKPRHTPLTNTWGVMAWAPTFTRLCAATPPLPAREMSLSHVVNRAVALGHRVEAEELADAVYCDAGTPSGLAAARRLVRHVPGPEHSRPSVSSRCTRA